MLPNGLVKLRPDKVLHKVRNHTNHLDPFFLFPTLMDVLGDHHKKILTAYCVEPTNQRFIESCKELLHSPRHGASFEDAYLIS